MFKGGCDFLQEGVQNKEEKRCRDEFWKFSVKRIMKCGRQTSRHPDGNKFIQSFEALGVLYARFPAKELHRHSRLLLSGIQCGKFNALWIQGCGWMTDSGHKSLFYR
jgi:hypothetical protein